MRRPFPFPDPVPGSGLLQPHACSPACRLRLRHKAQHQTNASAGYRALDRSSVSWAFWPWCFPVCEDKGGFSRASFYHSRIRCATAAMSEDEQTQGFSKQMETIPTQTALGSLLPDRIGSTPLLRLEQVVRGLE